MSQASASAVSMLQSLYDRGGAVEISDFLRSLDEDLDDESLAEVIEADGRKRLRLGLEVTLERYFDAVPDLRRRDIALDAALDVALRSVAKSSRIDDASIEAMVRRHPELAVAIREAATLNNAIWSTAGLREVIETRPTKSLPSDFGPKYGEHRRRYQLRELLGVGASGQVYLAVDRQMSDKQHLALVAIKILPHAKNSPLVRMRMSDEATKARRIDDPNVVRVIDRGTIEEDEDYIVWEYVEGGDLGDWLKKQLGPVPLKRAAEIVAKIARGVQAAHNAGLVHCDLKPSNIMLTASGEPKVADFGIATRVDDPAAARKNEGSGAPIGNLAFISPEQFRMEDGAFTPPSDVYALGGILFLLLTGRLPNGDSVREIEHTHHVVDGRTSPPNPSDARSEVDGDLAAICRRAMAVRPQDRYSAAGSLADDLEAWIRREPIRWTNPSTARVISLWARRRPAVAAATFLSAAAITAALVFGIQAREQSQRREALRSRILAFGQNMYSASVVRPPTTRLLRMVWTWNVLLEREFVGQPLDVAEDWMTYVGTFESFIAEAEAAGRGHHLEVLQWKMLVAFWSIGHNDFGKAERLLTDIRDVLESRVRLAPDDEFFGILDAFEACIVLRRAAVFEAPIQRSEVEEAAEIVAALDQHLWETDRGSPLHYLMLETEVLAFGRDLLDDEARLAAAKARIEALDLEDFVHPGDPVAGDDTPR